ncbi:hypothetical protein OHA74_14335 [Streptomyces phaeochromogenes]|uniref:hypothetical protein n=1 Tax=Streptomyces phaeochromogenes TaxID=1923 RepID=UPI002E2C5E3D|nr:hypothetical protein [Streptomyces phaeochromogenes]
MSAYAPLLVPVAIVLVYVCFVRPMGRHGSRRVPGGQLAGEDEIGPREDVTHSSTEADTDPPPGGPCGKEPS